jgi:hypothetical protein
MDPRSKETCKRKVSYLTQREANVVGRKHNQRSYECQVCFCWHLTKMDFTPKHAAMRSETNSKGTE